MPRVLVSAAALWTIASLLTIASAAQHRAQAASVAHSSVRFSQATTCMACHNQLRDARGEDISIGTDWRGSIMANSSRDPYWQASVRREVLDHPAAGAAIEDECAACHMPMSRTLARAAGRLGRVFEHLPVSTAAARPDDRLAHDGVSCTICHQIANQKLGTRDSFTGGFVVGSTPSGEPPPVFGPFQIDRGRTAVMQSAAGFRPTEAAHIRQSEVCATCHTLYTKARGPQGEVVGELPEQTPYLEWRHSAFPAEGASCGTCHMPIVRGDTPIASVLGTPRPGVARHVFRGGNAFMLRMLQQYRGDLAVAARPEELDAAVRWTTAQLQADTASLTITRAAIAGGRLDAELSVRNFAGHKLPSGYPSRRVWIALTVRDRSGATIFESGRLAADGSIAGNDNDRDPSRYEPHHLEIREADQVQIYESIMGDVNGAVTTGLLKAVRYLKDNRLLPRGFEKATAHADIAAIGSAAGDDDFTGGSDLVRYSIAVPVGTSPVSVEAVLYFQPIAARWARNLKPYDAEETRRFVRYFESMTPAATEVLGRATTSVR